MWEKNFQKHNSMTYRKLYKCPKCNEYSLIIIHDTACECIEGCSGNDNKIENIIKENDFLRYLTREDLINNLWMDLQTGDEIFKDTFKSDLPYHINNRDNNILQEYFNRTYKLDEYLDDVVVRYYNYFDLKEIDEFKPFNYLITLIEDMHYYMNLTCKDIYLFDLSISQKLKYHYLMYSGAFFGNNAIDHLFQANERMYVLLGIIYGYPFKEDLSKNKTFRIKDFLKKNSDYKTIFSGPINKLNGDTLYTHLEEIRNCNEHDLSYQTKQLLNDIKSNQDKLGIMNKSREEIDKEFYIPIIKNINFCLEILFEVLEKIVVIIDNSKYYSLASFSMYDKFLAKESSYSFKKFDMNYYNKLQEYNGNLVENVRCYAGDKLIMDIYFRLDEILHCIRDIYNSSTNSPDISFTNFYGFIKMDYIIYSAITRIYSCYDKISRYISSQFMEFENIKYFDDFSRIESNNTTFRYIKDIINNEAYIKLQEIRNIIYHNLRAGIIFGEDGYKFYNDVLIQLIMENELLLLELLEKLRPIKNKKIGRNSPCPCGSKIKYKFCHGKEM